MTLPLPISDNALFLNVRGRGRVKTPKYRDWISRALPIVETMPPIVSFPVAIDISVRNGRGWRSNCDIQNRIKSTPDLLVTAKIIPDDKVGYVVDVRVRYDHRGGQRKLDADIVVRITPVI